jgi:hypothetical protein
VAELILDESHRYWYGDRELVGCTNGLKNVGIIDTTHYTEEAMARGTAVHGLIAHRLIYGRAKGPKPFSGYLQAALKYLEESKAEILNVEMPLADLVLGIGGQPDLIALVNIKHVVEPRFAVIDWKTGGPERWHGYQTAWYEHLARVNRLVEGLVDRIVVHLKDDGTYTTRQYKERSDWNVADAIRVIEQAKLAA